MKINGLVWNDTGGYGGSPINGKDINYIGSTMNAMGHEYKYWDRDSIHASIQRKSGHSRGLLPLVLPSNNENILECDVLLVQLLWLVRFGGKASKWDADVCKVLNAFDGPVIVFVNDQLEYSFLKTATNPKFGENTLRRPIYIADDRSEINPQVQRANVEVLGHLKLNQTWSYAWSWKEDRKHMEQLLDRPAHPDHDFIYGGMVRKSDFNARLDNLFEVFGHDNCISYGKIADKWGFDDLAKKWGRKFATPDQLIELNSSCRYSALPYDEDKDYITSRCFEQGFADCLVLCDKGYNQEDCGFPVVDFTDKDAITAYRDLPEDERLKMVEDQHERLAAIDYKARSISMIRKMFDSIHELNGKH